MNDRNCLRAITVLATGAALLAGCGGSIAPAGKESGDAGESSKYQESWQGTTTGANPSTIAGVPAVTPCSQADDPTCGHHRLVVPEDVKQVLVVIQPDQENQIPEDTETGLASNDYTLTVYDDANTLVAYSESAQGSAAESVVFDHTGSAYYDVRVSPFLVAPGSSFTGTAVAVQDRPASDAMECLQPAPAAIGLAGVTDAGQEVELSVAVLLDGVDPQMAADYMARAADAYAPLSIRLTVAGTLVMPLVNSASDLMIAETKELTGGKPPFGADLAVMLTTKTMQAATGGAGTVLGQADCIGGVRSREHSYLVATVTPESPFELIPGLYIDVERGPETIAHEIGHLMGAHHHYGNCVEGVSPDDAANGDVSPCDLMFPSVEPLSMNFSTLAGAVVRGHAVDFASP